MMFLTKIAKAIKDWHDKNRIANMKREDVEDVIDQNIKLHTDISSSLKDFTDQEMCDWMTNKVRPALDHSNDEFHTCLDEYYKHLGNGAMASERKCPLSSLRKANSIFAKILAEIKPKLDDFFDKDSVDIYETKMSTLAVLGMLRDSNLIANFSMYLFTYLTRIGNDTAGSIPKYRNKFVMENAEQVGKIISRVLEHRGDYNFLDDVSRMRKQNADMVLGFGGNIDFDQRAAMNFYPGDLLDTLLGALSHLNIFKAIGNAWLRYKVNRNNKIKESREWLINHVAIMRMDLADKKPSSPEYNKILNVIKTYDAKIAEYDKEIQDFENGE
jgi:hypothetical protein